jgi:putative oxidoreductase
MKQLFFKTNNHIAPLFLRIFLALVLFPHGAQKLFGWFGGYGFAGTMDYFKNSRGMPWILGFLVIVIEFFGPIALLLGAATKLWSIAISAIMTGVILTTFNQYFFMNWFGLQKTEGAEYFLLAIGMSLSLAMSGAGRYSVDARMQS